MHGSLPSFWQKSTDKCHWHYFHNPYNRPVKKPDITVDAQGIPCPMPIVKLAQAIGHMQENQIIEILATDHSFIPDVETWCRKAGHRLIRVEEKSEIISALIPKTSK
jgi:tRNA 2-thiouridine synthesizing protein A